LNMLHYLRGLGLQLAEWPNVLAEAGISHLWLLAIPTT
jgi:hypothetical protein